MEAKEWLRVNDPARRFRAKKYKAMVAHKRGKIALGPAASSVAIDRKARDEEPVQSGRFHAAPPSALAFLKQNVGFQGEDCLFMPFANGVSPRKVKFRGKPTPCSRVMCTLAHGEPSIERPLSRHLCGNGHLSCVNPAHLAWGSDFDNACDAQVHRCMALSSAAEKAEAAKLAEALREKCRK